MTIHRPGLKPPTLRCERTAPTKTQEAKNLARIVYFFTVASSSRCDRKRLLRAGAFPTLLAAMEAPMVDEAVSRTINKSCSVGLMYLATIADDEIDAKQVIAPRGVIPLITLKQLSFPPTSSLP